jgi:hypothetical protein
MKTIRFIFALALLATVTATVAPAQVSVNFGVRGGLNMSTFHYSGTGEVSPRLGFIGGAFSNVRLHEMFSVQPEVLYASRGARLTPAGEPMSEYRADYIQVPLLFKFHTPTLAGMTPSIYAGPTVAFKVSESVRTAGVATNVGAFETTEFGVAFGTDVGVAVIGQRTNLGIGLRYALGLTEAGTVQAPATNFRHGAFTVSGIVSF